MRFQDFVNRVAKLFPEGEINQDDEGFLTIETGWKIDPDAIDHVYRLDWHWDGSKPCGCVEVEHDSNERIPLGTFAEEVSAQETRGEVAIKLGCTHLKYADGHCAEMVCWNYSQKCLQHSFSGRSTYPCSIDIKDQG